MKLTTHFLISWVAANAGDLDQRDRLIVTVAGVAPDLDALGIIAEGLTYHTEQPLWWYLDYHHLICHNLCFGLLTSAVAFAAANRRWRAAALVLVVHHLHLLADWAGSAGSDGTMWPIYYFWPFSTAKQVWSGSWGLASWQNLTVTAVVLGITLRLAWRRGFSPLELFSKRADAAFVGALRARFGKPE